MGATQSFGRRRARALAFASFLVALVTANAHAGPPTNEATAQLLFREGRALMQQGRYADACPKLEESNRLGPAIGTEFNLADCYEHTGKLASAWALFLNVAAETKARGQKERAELATERAQTLEPRLGKLVIEVPTEARVPGLDVKRDGQTVTEPLWGVAIPVDAGEHVLDSAAPGYQSAHTRVTTQDGSIAKIAIGALAVRIETNPPPIQNPAPNGPPEKPADKPVLVPSNTQRTIGWIALGGAVAATGVGAFALFKQQQEIDDYNADKTCPGKNAPRPQTSACESHLSTGETMTTVLIASAAIAGAAATTGIVLLLTAPDNKPRATSQTICAPTLSGIGASCVMRF